MYIVSRTITKTHKGGVFRGAGAGLGILVGYTSPFYIRKRVFKEWHFKAMLHIRLLNHVISLNT